MAVAGTKVINLDGKTVLPGLTDAHLHWEAQSRALRSVNVFEVPSKALAVERVSERVNQTAGWRLDIRAGLGTGFVG